MFPDDKFGQLIAVAFRSYPDMEDRLSSNVLAVIDVRLEISMAGIAR